MAAAMDTAMGGAKKRPASPPADGDAAADGAGGDTKLVKRLKTADNDSDLLKALTLVAMTRPKPSDRIARFASDAEILQIAIDFALNSPTNLSAGFGLRVRDLLQLIAQYAVTPYGTCVLNACRSIATHRMRVWFS